MSNITSEILARFFEGRATSEENNAIGATALHKLGVILIPATLQLTKKDIVYRGNAAEVKAVICVDDDFVVGQMEASAPQIPSLKHRT